MSKKEKYEFKAKLKFILIDPEYTKEKIEELKKHYRELILNGLMGARHLLDIEIEFAK